MKKSMLLSTTITVVVLILALSTATFAWFTVNGSVAVSSSTFTAQSGDNLQIASATYSTDVKGDSTNVAGYTIGEWGSTYTLNSYSKTFADISSADGKAFYNEDNSSYSGSDGYYTDYFYLSSGAGATLYLTSASAVSATNSSLEQDTLLQESIRIAIYAGDALVMYWAPITENESLISIDSSSTGGTTATVSASKLQNGALVSNFELATYDTTTLQAGVLFTVVIWMEGTDDECVSEAANGSISVSLGFSISST
ncbi:MAG: hypothetical protein R3Y23_01500 [Bacillota bacterium]